MAKIIWTREANQWLKDIFDHIKKDNIEAAKNVVNGIYDKTQVLIKFPEIGYKYKHESKRNIRILLYGHYRIAYEVTNSNNVFVLGVYHGALKMENYLF